MFVELSNVAIVAGDICVIRAERVERQCRPGRRSRHRSGRSACAAGHSSLWPRVVDLLGQIHSPTLHLDHHCGGRLRTPAPRPQRASFSYHQRYKWSLPKCCLGSLPFVGRNSLPDLQWLRVVDFRGYWLLNIFTLILFRPHYIRPYIPICMLYNKCIKATKLVSLSTIICQLRPILPPIL